ncbi:FMRFamide receptor-like [Pecten maximus]|uniref:FMRFamide receptor-like n=1 Tax=Pecten maximus TaxID=6579 RepID=UPI00145827FD|nr:FMRFamide receptor-like [Pecten maximus]
MGFHLNSSEYHLFNNSFREESVGRPSLYDDIIFIMYGVVVPLVVAFGYVGNILTAVVLKKKTMKPITSIYLQALVLSDIAFITCAFVALSVPILLAVCLNPDIGLNVFNTRGYIVINFFLMTSQLCNEYILVLVSIDRYVCVCHSQMHARIFSRFKVRVSIFGVLFFSALYNIPRILAVKIEESPCYNSSSTVTCYSVYLTEFGESFFYQKVYAVWIYAGINFVIPIMVLLNLNIFIVRKLMRKRLKRKRLGLRRNSAKDHVTLVLILIMTIFTLIQTLGFINQVYYMYTFEDSHTRTYLVDIVNVLYVINSSINFIIYIVIGEKFRGTFSQLVKSKCIGVSYRH